MPYKDIIIISPVIKREIEYIKPHILNEMKEMNYKNDNSVSDETKVLIYLIAEYKAKHDLVGD